MSDNKTEATFAFLTALLEWTKKNKGTAAALITIIPILYGGFLIVQDQLTWYKDHDEDGYGLSTETKIDFTKPPGYSEKSGDCDDDSFNINPSATDFYKQPRKHKDFDYNCDEKNEKQYPKLGECIKGERRDGWLRNVPECGEEGNLLMYCNPKDKGVYKIRIQACR